METLGMGLDMFGLDNGRYPTTDEGLAALIEQPMTMSWWDGPYLKGPLPRDPWGNSYVYESLGVIAL